jgi:hypothetical protein
MQVLSLSFKYAFISENHGSKSQSQQIRTSSRLRSARRQMPPPHPHLESDDSDEGMAFNMHSFSIVGFTWIYKK